MKITVREDKEEYYEQIKDETIKMKKDD